MRVRTVRRQAVWWGRPHKLNCTQQATDFVAPTFFDTCSKKTLPLVEITVSAGPRARCEASWPTTHHSHVQHARLTRWRCGVIRCNEDRYYQTLLSAACPPHSLLFFSFAY